MSPPLFVAKVATERVFPTKPNIVCPPIATRSSAITLNSNRRPLPLSKMQASRVGTPTLCQGRLAVLRAGNIGHQHRGTPVAAVTAGAPRRRQGAACATHRCVRTRAEASEPFLPERPFHKGGALPSASSTQPCPACDTSRKIGQHPPCNCQTPTSPGVVEPPEAEPPILFGLTFSDFYYYLNIGTPVSECYSGQGTGSRGARACLPGAQLQHQLSIPKSNPPPGRRLLGPAAGFGADRQRSDQQDRAL